MNQDFAEDDDGRHIRKGQGVQCVNAQGTLGLGVGEKYLVDAVVSRYWVRVRDREGRLLDRVPSDRFVLIDMLKWV